MNVGEGTKKVGVGTDCSATGGLGSLLVLVERKGEIVGVDSSSSSAGAVFEVKENEGRAVGLGAAGVGAAAVVVASLGAFRGTSTRLVACP